MDLGGSIGRAYDLGPLDVAVAVAVIVAAGCLEEAAA